MDVVNLDAWVSSFLRSHGYRHQVVFGEDENEAWAFALNLAPAELGLGRHFYRSEHLVILILINMNIKTKRSTRSDIRLS